jgi:hypothetical protein
MLSETGSVFVAPHLLHGTDIQTASLILEIRWAI